MYFRSLDGIPFSANKKEVCSVYLLIPFANSTQRNSEPPAMSNFEKIAIFIYL